jgi:hypothetical protein
MTISNHDGRLSTDDAEKLWNHVRALEISKSRRRT